MGFTEYTLTGKFTHHTETDTGKDDWIDPAESYDDDWNDDAYWVHNGVGGYKFSETIELDTLDITRTIGRITKVEMHIKWAVSPGTFEELYVRPYFNGSAGDSRAMQDDYGASGNEYINITSDTNAPSNWQWGDLGTLTIQFTAAGDSYGDTIQAYEIQIRVTYTLEAFLNISDSFKEISEMKINIGDSWKNVVHIKINIGDVWKDLIS